MDSELQLIERARSGERAAFGSLVDIHKGRAFALAFHFTGNAEDAKDVLQDAFVKAYIGIKDFKGASGFYTWFYRILVNLCRDFLRRKKAKTMIFMEPFELPLEEDDNAASEAADKMPDPSEAVVNKEIKEKVDEAVSRLPERQRTVFILKHIQGMRLNEIAAVIDCGESTARVHLFRAEKALQEMLAPYLSAKV